MHRPKVVQAVWEWVKQAASGAAMGAALANPGVPVACVTGESSIQMCLQELSTCKQYRLPLKIVNLNNRYMGMVRQWQEFFHGNRYSQSYMDALPDFVKLADAYGAVGLSCDKPADVDATIKKAMEIDDVPVVVDFRVHRDAMVWPMVAAGTSNDEIKYARDLAPEWEADEL